MIWYVGIFLATFTASLAIFAVLILVLPPRYFVDDCKLWKVKHSVFRLLGLAAKNLLGVALIVLGLLLSLPGIPGQGLLTVAVGAMLLDIPGKHRLVRSVVQRRGVLRSLNRFRRWFGRPPLVMD